MTLPQGTDELLVAYLDNELSASERSVLQQRLEQENNLAERLAFLECSNLPFRTAFAPLLDAAPLAHLQTYLPQKSVARSGVSRRNLLAAAVCFLALGVAGDRVFLHFSSHDENWREMVAQYMALYSAETLANTPSPEALDQQLQTTGKHLDLALSRADLSLANATLKNARVLAYDAQFIAQITWLDATHGPLALCITHRPGAQIDAAIEQRLGMNIVYWASTSHQFMVIGHNSAVQLSEFALQLQKNIGS